MSINIEHKDISVGEIHSPFQWEVLNVAELSTIVPEGVNDVRKVAFVVDDGTGNPTAYVLTQFTPAIEWKPLATGSTGWTVLYSTTKPVPTTIGGIEAGKEYTDEDIKVVINDLLFPYQYPAFLTFTVDGASFGSYEVGYTFPAGNKNFVWTTSNNENIKVDSVNLNGTTGLTNDGNEVQATAAITKTTVSTHVFNISATNTKDQVFSKTITLSWGMKRFWGVSPNTSIDDVELLAMNGEIATSRVKTVTYDCTGGRYFYFAYPTAWGDLNNTKINSLTWNDWVLVKRDVINQYGVAIPMNIYRSYNLLNGTVTVVWG